MTDKKYEQKKRECWKEFQNTIFNNPIPISPYTAFSNAFDRAYGLGKQTETITQEEIVEAAKKYDSEHAYYNSNDVIECFVEGANFALGKQEKDADAVIQGWVAVDDDGGLFLYRTKPARDEVSGMWMCGECPLDVGINLFPDLTWDSEPEPVEIIIKRKKNGNNSTDNRI